MSVPLSPPASRRWSVTATTAFPKGIASDLSGGFPDKLEFCSRFRAQQVRMDDFIVELRHAEASVFALGDWGMSEPVLIRIECDADSAASAVESSSSLLDLVLDVLSFQLQEPVKAFALEVLDVTPPLAVGEMRETLSYPFPNGYDQFKLGRSTALSNVWTVDLPVLRDDYVSLPDRVQDALDWYIKGLHAQFDADRFIFFWIAFEVLRGQYGPRVERATRLRCGHQLDSCPTCSKPTAQPRQRDMALAYLESLGVENSVAERLWSMRQIVHGARRFTPAALSDLSELLQVLRAASLLSLKRALSIPDAAAPVAESGGVAISTAIALGGTRQIDLPDL